MCSATRRTAARAGWCAGRGRRAPVGRAWASPDAAPGPACAVGTACCNDACVDTLSDVRNCGGCGVTCRAATRCAMGRCVADDRCGGGPACPAEQNCCGAACVDTRTDPSNCGACGRACAQAPNSESACVAGACQAPTCAMGFADCNRTPRDGCEANLGTDTANCGACGAVCPAGQACQAGRCGMPSTGAEGAFNPRVNPDLSHARRAQLHQHQRARERGGLRRGRRRRQRAARPARHGRRAHRGHRRRVGRTGRAVDDHLAQHAAGARGRGRVHGRSAHRHGGPGV